MLFHRSTGFLAKECCTAPVSIVILGTAFVYIEVNSSTSFQAFFSLLNHNSFFMEFYEMQNLTHCQFLALVLLWLLRNECHQVPIGKT